MDTETLHLAAFMLVVSLFLLLRILYKRFTYKPIEVKYVGSRDHVTAVGIWSYLDGGKYHEITDGFIGETPFINYPGKTGIAYVNLKGTSKSLTPSWKWHVFVLSSFAGLEILCLYFMLMQ